MGILFIPNLRRGEGLGFDGVEVLSTEMPSRTEGKQPPVGFDMVSLDPIVPGSDTLT